MRRVGAVALLVCSLSCADLGSGADAAAGVSIGVHSMLQLNSPYSFMQAMFAEAARMHVSPIRLDVAPALVFPDPSQPPDFSGLDEVMALSQQYHLQVIADLSTIPPWIAACPIPTDTSDTATCVTNEFDEYRALIGEIVAHADPVIGDWEIWNEPDLNEFFRGTPQQYAQMLRAAMTPSRQSIRRPKCCSEAFRAQPGRAGSPWCSPFLVPMLRIHSTSPTFTSVASSMPWPAMSRRGGSFWRGTASGPLWGPNTDTHRTPHFSTTRHTLQGRCRRRRT